MRARRLRLTVSMLAAAVGLGLLAGSATGATSTVFGNGIPVGTEPLDIAAGPDGNLWFTGSGADSVGRITPAGAVTMFTDGITSGAAPAGIAAGPDGNVWFTQDAAIGRITPGGTVTEFSDGLTSPAGPLDIAAGPDGNLWFTAPDSGLVGRISPSGDVTELTDGISPDAAPAYLTAGPDGNVWFTDYAGDRIGRVTPAGVVTEFATPGAGPLGIAPGPDGNLWFAAYDAVGIGRITPAGTVTTFPLSTGLGPIDITSGPDGHLWFVRDGSTSLERIAPSGVVAPYYVVGQHLGTPIRSVALGPDGSLWATAPAQDGILRLTPGPPHAETGTPVGLPPTIRISPTTGIGLTTATLNALVDAKGTLTSVDIDYGPTPAYGKRMRHAMNVAAGTSGPMAVSRTLTRLTPGTTYHYRLSVGSVRGKATIAGTFTTLAPPAIAGLRMGPSVVSTRRGAKPAAISFRSSAAGIVRIVVQRLSPGRWKGTTCVAPTRALVRARAQTCVHSTSSPEVISRRSRPAGMSTMRFVGRVGTRLLAPGSYRLRATLHTSYGPSAVATARFRVVRASPL